MASKAEKRLERMKRSKSGWKRKDVDKTYEHFGFVDGGGTKHDKFYHPDYPQLVAFVPRSKKVAEYVITTLIQNVEKLKKLKELEEVETEQKDDEE